ncbi:hypothetical protein EWM64_g2775 [Hericium alpestre]|uniref:Lysine-specific metallo-endopeptidase domain-containing protein n=1 Tax=Hericium alpestre TaxID=135208 RepID=A0A4Z0A4I0_9AGAM|nr:hypothetical protein EWM64_g2775 [Hericium alpestre]
MKFLSLLSLAIAAATAHAASVHCDNKHTLSTAFVGQDSADRRARRARQAPDERLRGHLRHELLHAPGRPDPNECHVIADALLYDSQNIGALFNMDPAQNTSLIVMTFRSCQTFIVNQTPNALTYCRTDWASLVDWIAPNCQATQNAHGGNCVARDQQWFVQVQHS